MTIPNLAGVATAELVEKIGGGNFSASYINWSRTLQLLREHAPGWLPELIQTAEGGILHRSPVGGFLLLRFVNVDSGASTPPVPQAVMDQRNAAIPFDKITARDITDTHRRGVCMAAALTFGLAYELWAKLPLESGYAPQDEQTPAPPPTTGKALPTDGVWEFVRSVGREAAVREIAATAQEYLDADDVQGALNYLHERAGLKGNEERSAVHSLLASYEKSALKKAKDGDLDGAIAHLIRNRQKKAA